MSIFDLLLILLVLCTAAALVAAAAALCFRRRAASLRLIGAVLAVWAVYLGAGTAVAMLTPQRAVPVGEDRCFDEMCFAVTGFRRVAALEAGGVQSRARGEFLIVDLRVSNRSQAHAQREAGRTGMLLDAAGHSYKPSPEGMRALSRSQGPLPGLDGRVEPGQSVNTHLVFDVPANIRGAGFVLDSDLAIDPARIVIADEAHFLHKPTMVPLE